MEISAQTTSNKSSADDRHNLPAINLVLEIIDQQWARHKLRIRTGFELLLQPKATDKFQASSQRALQLRAINRLCR